MRPIFEFIKHPQAILSSYIKNYGQWIPDTWYLRLQYRLLIGKTLHWKNPQTFTEKLQWLKVNRRSDEMTTMVDKYAVKDYVAERIGKQYIIPTLGVWNSLEEVDWDSLPESFVLKTTHGGGGTGVVVVRDKKNTDRKETLKKLRWSFNHEGYSSFREWPYKNVRHRIIAEELIEIPGNKDLTDYKIFCFNGIPQYIQVIQDRHTCETIDFYDTDWNHKEFIGLNPVETDDTVFVARNARKPVPRPKNLDEMLGIATKLSDGLDFIRVDLYQTERGILFGELTFYPASGFGVFTPDEYDLKLGKLLNISAKK